MKKKSSPAIKNEFNREYLGKLIREARKGDELRLHIDDTARGRPAASRDFTRILYSPSFRRLQGKMQLLGVDHQQFFRNRLTHSLEAAQIARSIAVRTLVYKKADELLYVQTAALAHDLGNPPFGHYGEGVLNELSEKAGGFDGNAQTLRILTRLEKKNATSRGLNMTLRTLLAVTKYFRKRTVEESKKFIYDDDYETLNREADRCEIPLRTIDAQVMDVADEIAYAAHDLEDALSLRLFNIEELLFEFRLWLYRKYPHRDMENERVYDSLNSLVNNARDLAIDAKNFHTSEEYSFIFRKELTGLLVSSLIRDVSLIKMAPEEKGKTGSRHSHELEFETLGDVALGLKKVTFNCINRTDRIQLYEKRGDKVLRDLFEVFTDKKFNSNYMLLPAEYRPSVSGEEPERCVIDYLSGMMDAYAEATHEKFFGKGSLARLRS